MVMFIWWKGKKTKNVITPLVALESYIPVFKRLSVDESIPKYATNLVFLTSSATKRKVEKNVIDSILNQGTPKRADIYWFVHVNVTNEPYGLNYDVDTVVKKRYLFHRIQPRISRKNLASISISVK